MSTATTRRTPAAGKRQEIEDKLAKLEFTFGYRGGVPLEEFDVDASLRNQARLGAPLDEELVDRYKNALRNGDVFPAVIAWERRNAKGVVTRSLVIADGNHRLAAHMAAGRKKIDAYIITGASPAALTMLTYSANVDHGRPLSEQDRIHHGLWMHDAGITVEEAAARVGIKPSALSSAIRRNRVDQRADEVGIPRPKWDNLSPQVIGRLGAISTNAGFRAMAELAIEAKLSAAQVGQHVGEMRDLKDSHTQVDFVQALRGMYAENLQTGGGINDKSGRAGRTPRQRLGVALGAVLVMPDAMSIGEWMGPEERDGYAERVEQAIGRLQEIQKVLLG